MNSKSIIQYSNSIPKVEEYSFYQFVFSKRENKRLFSVAIILITIQFIIFKILYPFPDFFSDSYSYIYAASANLDVSIWPIGYSRFLLTIHQLTHSDNVVIGFQYYFLELSALYFFFTILFFFRPVKTTTILLFSFLFSNPLHLYICNYINSDSLFIALSILWITQLLWIVKRPTLFHLVSQSIFLFFAFTVRNNAYYYPVIAAAAFILSPFTIRLKFAGALLGLTFILPFIMYTRNASFKMIGSREFSLFTGWQLANNALYIYDKIHVDSNELKSTKAKELDRLSKQYFKDIPANFRYREYLSSYVGNYFIRQPEAPLKQYLSSNYKIKDNYSVIVAWGKASEVFAEYGGYIIRKNPIPYARYFMLLNTKNYFLPPLEKLEIYNLGWDDVYPIAKDWFNYKSTKITVVSKNLQSVILFVFPKLFLLVNVYLIVMAVLFIGQKKYQFVDKKLNFIFLLIALFLLVNFLFCVFATIIVLRYQVFPLIIAFSFSLILMDVYDRYGLKKVNAIDTVNRTSSQLQLKGALECSIDRK